MSITAPRPAILAALTLLLSTTAHAADLDQRAAAAHITSMTGARVKLAWVRAVDARVNYLGAGFKASLDPAWLVMVFDTDEGRERVFAPASAPDAYCHPLITPDGLHVVWTRARQQIMVADWDGQNAHVLCQGLKTLAVAEDPPGTQWVYVGQKQGSDATGSPELIYRYQLNHPAVSELVWSRSTVATGLALSRDGKWAVASFGGDHCGIARFPNGDLQIFGQGCGEGMAFDGSLRVWHMIGGHSGIQMYDHRDNAWTPGAYIRFDDAPGRNGAKVEWWSVSGFHWDGRFFCLTGPWQGPRHDSGNVIVAQFADDYRSVKQYIRLTDVHRSETFPYAWIAPLTPAPPRHTTTADR